MFVLLSCVSIITIVISGMTYWEYKEGLLKPSVYKMCLLVAMSIITWLSIGTAYANHSIKKSSHSVVVLENITHIRHVNCGALKVVDVNKYFGRNFKEGDIVDVLVHEATWSFGIYFPEKITYEIGKKGC